MTQLHQAQPKAEVINPVDPDFAQALSDYLKQFEYKVNVKLGSTFTKEYTDFFDWCRARLGQQYKDWFIYSLGKGKYCVFIKDSKWASFLALTHTDKLI